MKDQDSKPPLVTDLARRVEELEPRLEHIEELLKAVHVPTSPRPWLGPDGRIYILGPLREIAHLKARALGNEEKRVLNKLFKTLENRLRDRLGFPAGPGQCWSNFPMSRVGEACVVIARMRGEALAELRISLRREAKQLDLPYLDAGLPSVDPTKKLH